MATDPTQDTFDRYGRLLAYVDTTDAQLNLAQIRAGWSKVYIFERPFMYVEQYRAESKRARARDRGAWDICNGDFHADGTLVR